MTLNAVMISFKTNEIVDQLTTNNSLQIKRLQPFASLSKAQTTHTSARIDIL
jgi:hypothetical protein